jgi:hypothetical protein
MTAAFAYASRRTSARIVLAVGVGGLVWAVFRVARPHFHPEIASLRVAPAHFPILGSSPWETAVAALVAVLALVAAAALWRGRAISR